jgi:phosphoribosylaminoimidazole-succinocarboxamide synthase
MELIYTGKTKDVYQLTDGNLLLQFKDAACGENGVFDPGANTIGLTIEGMGRASLALSSFFFSRIIAEGIPTHFVSADLEKATMTVLPAKSIGHGLEVIARFRAVGSFLKRYGLYVSSGQSLDGLVEMTLKDDERQDPLATEDTLVMLGILEVGEYEMLKNMTIKVSEIVRTALSEKGLELYDIKFEYGRVSGRNELVLIDEVSPGNMRVYRDGKLVEPLELVRILL